MRYTNFDDIPINQDWAFDTVRSTTQWTHGYHRYPAKFLPNVVKKIIEDYAPQNGIIADLFAGCGTTLVEAKVHGRNSIGTDINPIATLITRVKTTPIKPDILQAAYNQIIIQLNNFNAEIDINIKTHERIDYWFRPEEKQKIAYLYQIVNNIKVRTVREFFLVAVSHILKNCSWWLQSSTKPQKDPRKNIPDPFDSFKHHCVIMMNANTQYYTELKNKKFLKVTSKIYQADARQTQIDDTSIDIIITSPPYVTSYEYADIHQLTGYWMEYFSDIMKFRKLFIGTSYSGNTSYKIPNNKLGQAVVTKLLEKDTRLALDVANYFNDMQSVSKEIFRILKPNGYACIVIGNTTLKDVHIKSAEFFFDCLRNTGLEKVNIIKRNIPNKLMPTLRDPVTGRFTTLNNKDCKQVYPDEYIIIVKR